MEGCEWGLTTQASAFYRLPPGTLRVSVLVAAALAALAVRQPTRSGSRVAAALKAKGREDIRVVRQAGNGGTVDIGFGCLSGMLERNDDVLFVCYDNEGYMNTGVQRSGATPPAARTANTKALGSELGNVFDQGKFVPQIAMAHEIPYVATATVAELHDLEYKVEKAMTFRGARYLHVFVPCPLGWEAASADTIKLARLAKETAIFPVFEAEGVAVTEVSKIRRQVPVEDYLRPQKRYAHLFRDPGRHDIVERLQARDDRNIARFGPLPEGDRRWTSPWRSPLTSHRAGQTRPAPGAASEPSTRTGCHRATTPALRVRTSRPGFTRPKSARPDMSAPDARSWRTTRSRR
jgi:pyruvate/2-oxoacid:ferredoxin oxidoreductase beta subunit